jgi:hypothetical protein
LWAGAPRHRFAGHPNRAVGGERVREAQIAGKPKPRVAPAGNAAQAA